MAQEVLPNIGEREKRLITVELIQKHIANHYSLKLGDLKSRNNTQAIVMPRQIAMYLARTLTDASYPEIGKKFGKDHSTVMHAFKKIEKRKKDANFKAFIESFVKAIRKLVGRESAP